MSHMQVIAALLLLVSSYHPPANAQAAPGARGGIKYPGGYESWWSPEDVPERWKGDSRHVVRYVIPEPGDPPDIEARAKLIGIRHPGREEETLHLQVGDRIRLSPASKRDRWHLYRIGVLSGVLWPVPGARRVFYARCPGKSSVQFDRSARPPPTDPTDKRDWGGSQLATIDVEVDATAQVPPECRGGFDPPRIPNPGRITSKEFGWGISMRVGDTFVLFDDSGACGDRWNTSFKISDTKVLAAQRVDADGVHMLAIAPGIAELSVPDPVMACDHGAGITEPRGLILIDVK